MQVKVKYTKNFIIFWQTNFIIHYKLLSQKAEQIAQKSHNLREKEREYAQISLKIQ